MTNAVTLASLANSGYLRNRIINGAMMIDQRAAGASTTVTGNTYVTCDRWQTWTSLSSKYSVSQTTTAPTGFSNSLVLTSLSAYTPVAGDYFYLSQQIEGFNFADMAWGTANAKTITLSFWVRSSLTGTFGGGLENSAGDRSYPFTYAINSANTWEYKTITVQGDTTGTWVGATNGNGLSVWFGIGTGSTRQGTPNTWQAGNYPMPTGMTNVVSTNGATWYITGVQLEVGTQATPFEWRPFTTELSLSQRYYAKSYNIGTVPGTATSNGSVGAGGVGGANGEYLQLRFPVMMRAAPTVTQYSTFNGAAGNIFNTSTAANIGASALSIGEGGYVNPGVALASGNCYSWHYQASAEL